MVASASDKLSQVLTRILRSGSVPATLRIHSECQGLEGYRRATLYGSGVAIWNGDRQVPISRDAMTKVLESVRRYGFAAMPSSFGGRSDPAGAARAIRVTCLVEVDAEGNRKEVVQLEGGRQSPALKELAEDVFRAVDLSRATAIQAHGLDDAIEKLAAGSLAPEALDVSLQRQQDPRATANGWILRIVGRRLEVERDPGQPEAAERRRLSDPEYARLLAALAAAEPQAWPPNLYDAGYVDLRVRVLNHERSIQARAFAGMTPETHGSRQRAFAALLDVLSALALPRAPARGPAPPRLP
jgi:hypothetical protein